MIEIAIIIVAGIFAQWLAWKIKLPAILPLIIIGLVLGPVSTLFTDHGEKLLKVDKIFPHELLRAFVSLSVAVILFEGGLSLKYAEFNLLKKPVRNILTIGLAVLLITSGFAAHFLVNLDYRIAFLFASLIIVSGPTVIMPILRNVKLNQNVNTVLKWEAILIDPLGALIAVLIYEFIQTTTPGTSYTFIALKGFFLTIIAGVVVGIIAAFLVDFILKKNRIPEYLFNVVTLAFVIFSFTLAEYLIHESGLMAVTIMGMVLANRKHIKIKNILAFKEEMTLILTSILFIVLSSRITIEQINKIGVGSITLFFLITLVLRPLAVFVSTINSKLNLREKIYISWVNPKGIVAAAVASIFAVDLADSQNGTYLLEEASMLLPLVFLMIIGTVVLQGGTAKIVAKLLKVERKQSTGVLIAGANPISRFIARFLMQNNIKVIVADTSVSNIEEAKKENIPVYNGSIFDSQLFYDLDLADIGFLYALTSSGEINALASNQFKNEFGSKHVFRIISQREMLVNNLENASQILFSKSVDYDILINAIKTNPTIQEVPFTNEDELKRKVENKEIIPLFIKTVNGDFKVFSCKSFSDATKDDKILFISL